MKQREPDFGGPITATSEMELTTVEKKKRGAGVTVAGGLGGRYAGGITVHKAKVRCSSAASAAL